jgi:hypothetical protein
MDHVMWLTYVCLNILGRIVVQSVGLIHTFDKCCLSFEGGHCDCVKQCQQMKVWTFRMLLIHDLL